HFQRGVCLCFPPEYPKCRTAIPLFLENLCFRPRLSDTNWDSPDFERHKPPRPHPSKAARRGPRSPGPVVRLPAEIAEQLRVRLLGPQSRVYELTWRFLELADVAPRRPRGSIYRLRAFPSGHVMPNSEAGQPQYRPHRPQPIPCLGVRETRGVARKRHF